MARLLMNAGTDGRAGFRMCLNGGGDLEPAIKHPDWAQPIVGWRAYFHALVTEVIGGEDRGEESASQQATLTPADWAWTHAC